MLLMDPETRSIRVHLDNLFREWHDRQPPRTGLHASDVLKDAESWCFREHVIREQVAGEAPLHEVSLLRIFLEGWYVHAKWQMLFQSDPSMEAWVEQRCWSDRWQLWFTPDAVVTLLGKRYVVEIKSMNHDRYQRLRGPYQLAHDQVNLYMYLLGIPDGLILVEDKETSDYRLWVVPFEWKRVEPLLQRMGWLRQLQAVAQTTGRLPKRICQTPTERRALECPVRTACFAKRRGGWSGDRVGSGRELSANGVGGGS